MQIRSNKRRVLRWLPPIMADAVRVLRGTSTKFSRPYASWEAASRASSGYDSKVVLERVLASSRQVRDGHARYERDSVLFDRVEYSFPVLATLLRVALQRGGAVHVVDFGGALGSSYRECRPFLTASVHPVRWSVVEQSAFVEAGRREMQSDELMFFTSMREATQDHPADVVLFSSVLQYLRDPYKALEEASELGASHIVLDRTIVGRRPDYQRLHVQHVPRTIYSASYPVWVLSEDRIVGTLNRDYELLSEHFSLPFPELESIEASFKGFIFRSKGTA